MELFVSTFLSDEYVSYRSNRTDQAIHALVRRSFASDIKPWLPDSSTPQMLWRNVPFYPWGAIAGTDRKSHSLARYPLLLRARPASGQDVMLGGVHTKSKFSLLKTKKQWNGGAKQQTAEHSEGSLNMLGVDSALFHPYFWGYAPSNRQDWVPRVPPHEGCTANAKDAMS